MRSIDGLALGEGGVLARQRLLQRLHLLAILAGLSLGRGQDIVRLLLGVEEGFLLAGFDLALGVPHDARGVLVGPADGLGGDPLPVRHPDSEHDGRRQCGDQSVDQIAVYRHCSDCVIEGRRTRPRFAVWGGR